MKHEKKLKRQVAESYWMILILCLVAVWVFIGFARVYYKDYTVKQEIEQLNKEVESLERKKIESAALLEYIQTDSFVEQQARREFGLMKEGETVLVITDQNAVENDQVDPENSNRVQLTNVKKWWFYITHQDSIYD